MIDKLRLDRAHTPQNGAAAVTVKGDVLQYIRRNSKYGSVSIEDIMSSSLVQEWRVDITLSFEAIQLAVHMLIEEGYICGTSPFTLGDIQIPHIQLHCPEVEVEEADTGGES